MPCLRHTGLRPFVFFALGSLCLAASTAHAGLSYRLTQTQSQPGVQIELEGLLTNDTGAALSSPVARELTGQWVDAQGQVTPARFQLRTSPDAIDLPANTFTRMAWSGQVPAGAHGLLTLRLDGAADTLLALQVGAGALPGTQVAALGTDTPGTTAIPSAPPATGPAAATSTNGLSPFDTFRNAISPYEPIYFAVGHRDGANARFQVSFKYRLFSPDDPAHPGFMDNWYFGYTQTALWDLHSDSIPFVDTTYNPSLFWARDAIWSTADKRWSLGLNTGFEHKSNGKDEEDSRSLNDLYIQPQVDYRFDGGSTLSFMPRFKYYVWTDRDMDYRNALGYVDWKLRWAQDDGLVLSGLYRQGTQGRNATQLEAAWPLKRTFLHMNGHLYVQYFRGYGETLLDYDRKLSPQLRIGLALVP
ncbi:MAG: phospholipase A [Castellaniella sp.]|uniref:phospholipase A n=1 Tax=Castellaniella sp. TaxID=1955812 RepID=UPI002A36B3BA|nr:phospholipase A [Castellaniella sp.]MDY0308356.1 phospholipase A [Castellaniella sp.]